MAVGNLWPGCSEVTACFTSQVSALRWRGLQQAPASSKLRGCPRTAAPLQCQAGCSTSAQPWAQQLRGLSWPLQPCQMCCLQLGSACSPAQDCLGSQTTPPVHSSSHPLLILSLNSA